MPVCFCDYQMYGHANDLLLTWLKMDITQPKSQQYHSTQNVYPDQHILWLAQHTGLVYRQFQVELAFFQQHIQQDQVSLPIDLNFHHPAYL
ncbi:hypothetical protein BS420_11250 [Cronobacter sakazakii]|nr:hypothetical protein BS420_11250 [Cronobacter sakazakii]